MPQQSSIPTMNPNSRKKPFGMEQAGMLTAQSARPNQAVKVVMAQSYLKKKKKVA